MNSVLNIYDSSGYPDFMKVGNGNDSRAAVQTAYDGTLFSFFYPYHNANEPLYVCNNFKLQCIDDKGNILDTYDLNTSNVSVVWNGERMLFYYDGQTDLLAGIESYHTGIYRFKVYIQKSRTEIYYSEPFRITSHKYEVAEVADFDAGDFDGGDFYTGE